MKTTKRLLLILLALTMLMSSLLVGCKKDDATEDDSDSVAPEGSQGEVEETNPWGEKAYKLTVPDELDYDGDQVDILVRTKAFSDPRRYEWYADSFEGDALNTSIFYRNTEIEDELGITLNFPEKEDSEMNAYITENFAAGMGGVDIVSNYHYYGTSTQVMECYKNLMHPDFTYLQLENGYWNQNFIETATSFDRLFVVVGDMNLSAYMTAFCMYFNKTLLADWHNGMTDEELYQIVLNGEWTWDKMTELCLNTYDDITGDGKTIDDKYGFTSHANSHAYDGFVAAFDMDLTTTDSDGNHEFMDATAIRNLGDAADKLVNFYKTDDAFLVGYHSESYVQPVQNFKQQNSLFCVAGIGDSQHLKDMTDEYGMLPLPKYTKDQDRYYGGVQDSHNNVAVMYHGAQDYEQISAVLELFAYKSYNSVRPTLCEKVLKAKNLKDSTSMEIFDLVLDGTRWDFTDIYPSAVKEVRNTLWRGAIYDAIYKGGDGAGKLAEAIAGNKKTITDALKAHDEWLYTHY